MALASSTDLDSLILKYDGKLKYKNTRRLEVRSTFHFIMILSKYDLGH